MFSQRIRELREKAGYTSQQAFADSFGVAQSTVGGWEAGKREPNYDTIVRLARFFGTSIDYLLGYTPPVPLDLAKRGDFELNDEEIDLIIAYRTADSRIRQVVDLTLAPYIPPEQSREAM